MSRPSSRSKISTDESAKILELQKKVDQLQAERDNLLKQNKDLAQCLSNKTINLRNAEVLKSDLLREIMNLNFAHSQKITAIKTALESCLPNIVQLTRNVPDAIYLCTNKIDNTKNGELNITPKSTNSFKNKTRAVRPMVSGHTISNPTIKLSRLSQPFVQENEDASATVNGSMVPNDTETAEGGAGETALRSDMSENLETYPSEMPEEIQSEGNFMDPRLETLAEVTEDRSSIAHDSSSSLNLETAVNVRRRGRLTITSEDSTSIVETTNVEERSEIDNDDMQRLNVLDACQTSTPNNFVTIRPKRQRQSTVSFTTPNSNANTSTSQQTSSLRRSTRMSSSLNPMVMLRRLSLERMHSPRPSRGESSVNASNASNEVSRGSRKRGSGRNMEIVEPKTERPNRRTKTVANYKEPSAKKKLRRE